MSPARKRPKLLDVAYIHARRSRHERLDFQRPRHYRDIVGHVFRDHLGDWHSERTALHGGANEGVIHMLQEIGSEDKVDEYVEDCLANKKKIMGLDTGFTGAGSSCAASSQMAVKLTDELGEAKWIRMSERIAELMKEKKNLNANVDFYSATVYYSWEFRPICSRRFSRFRVPPDGPRKCWSNWTETVSIVP